MSYEGKGGINIKAAETVTRVVKIASNKSGITGYRLYLAEMGKHHKGIQSNGIRTEIRNRH